MAEWKHANGVIHSYCGYYGTAYPWYASDGNWGNVPSWRCESNHKHWIVLDMGSSFVWSEIRQYHRGEPGGRWLGVDIYVGDDPANLGEAVATDLSFLDDWVWNERDLTTQKSGRYVKLADISTQGAGGYLNKVHEIQVYQIAMHDLNLCMPRGGVL